MAQKEGESNSKGKAVAAASSAEQPKPEFNCPRCDRTFHSAPALSGHQNAHRLLKESMKMSPVQAAVLNNPLSPDHDKPVLIPPGPKPAEPIPPKLKVSKRHCAEAVSPRYHPYQRLQKEPILEDLNEEVNSYDNNPEPDHKKAVGEDFLGFLQERLEAEAEYHPYHYEMVVPDDHDHEYIEEEYYSLLVPDDQFLITRDLLREWTPICSLHDHAELGKASRQTLSAHNPAINLKNFAMEEGEADGLGIQLGSSRPNTGRLDLELKLGFC
ncbi:hypothetical protein REPUB_Repub06bG0136100 [Reevesia pubescens]